MSIVNKELLSSALCDMYDIRAALPLKIKMMPKDNEGTEISIADCIEDVIYFLQLLEGDAE